jgi:acyl transferase domain-containing protein/3-hydroxymyristoyl/3-hydroxydecanoyl-(acyl carrier protein) dehydratase
MSAPPRIAIVGLGGVFPAAPSSADLWTHIVRAADTSRDVPPVRWLLDPAGAYRPGGPTPDHVYCRRGYFIEGFQLDPAGLDLPASLLVGLDPVFHLALHAGRAAWQSGVTARLDRRRVPVILGNIALPTERASALAREYLGRTFAEKLGCPGKTGASGGSALNRHVAGLPAGVLARALGLGGGAFTLDAACASSLYAVKLAMDELRARRADAVLAGGVSRPDCLYTQMGFSQLRALSPSGRCAPFDARGDGLLVGEGAGVFLLKRLEDALRDGDRILAVLVAAGLSNDVGGSLLAPSSEGQLRAMRAAYRAAGWSPRDVDLIECHATGTPVGDAVEYQSLRTLWGDYGWQAGQCVLGSVKSTVGHLLTAAGAAGLAKVIHALAERTLPPTANFVAPPAGLDFERSPFRVLRQPQPWHPRQEGLPRRAAISGFGFGGINAHVLLEEFHGAATSREPRTAHRSPTVAVRCAEAAIAVIALDARFGPWQSLAAFRQRVLGDSLAEPQPPRHWWGVPDAAWFRDQGLAATSFAGFYLDRVIVDAGRFRIPPRELEEMLPQQLHILQVAETLLRDQVLSEEQRLRTGVFVGVGLDLNTTNFHVRWSLLNEVGSWAAQLGRTPTPAELNEWLQRLRDAAGPPLTANRTMGALASIAASRVAREYRLGGPSFTLAGEEASGLRALETAVRALQRGDIDLALAGAVDLAGDVRAVLASHRLRQFSRQGRARPFDAAADGTVVGEGAAAVLLKRLDDAERDGDEIHAVIRGIGSAGGGDLTHGLPDGAAYRAALERAYRETGIHPVSVGYVEAHGSGHPDEDALEARELAAFFGGDRPLPLVLGSAKADIGHAGAAAGLAAFVKACLCLEHQVLPSLRGLEKGRAELAGLGDAFVLPRSPRFWLRNRCDGPRRAGVSAFGIDGSCVHVVLEGREPPARVRSLDRPLGAFSEGLFAIDGRDPAGLVDGLQRLRDRLTRAGASVPALARAWLRDHPPRSATPCAVTLVARDAAELAEQIDIAQRHLSRSPERPLAPSSPTVRDRVFYSPHPLGALGKIAFVFPGSGNDFPGMGRELGVRFPEILSRQDAENERLYHQLVPWDYWNDETAGLIPARERIFGQVALGALVSDLLHGFGVRPEAAIGHSLGESAALFALRAWTGRDEMLRRMHASPLFTRDLTGPCEAARRAWSLPPGTPVDWLAGVVDQPPETVRAALIGLERVYLLMVNTPRECVIGGAQTSVETAQDRLGGRFIPMNDPTTVHCPVVRTVAEAYRDLHRLPTTPPPGVRFYSAALGRAYDLSADSAAEAILAQALDTVDFPTLIEAAYRDGVRLFIEMGPGASCGRMISATLGDRPHRARSACVAGGDPVSTVLRLLALLIAERVPVNLANLYGPEPAAEPVAARPLTVPVGGAPFDPPPPPAGDWQARTLSELEGLATGPEAVANPSSSENPTVPVELLAVQEAYGGAHGAYLRYASAVQRTFAETVALQTTLLEALVTRGAMPMTTAAVVEVPRALDRARCLEYAIGSIARVLGPDFAEADTFPTRVRLPDEPLMLVDRILRIEGEPRSLTSGRVLTEHDVRPASWYLDAGRIPTCIAVEAGQADLFLSGFLGIDFRTRGQAVYRLLDAVVTFHRGLPEAGATIRYDIHIDRFFRQGDTHLFRFRFEGTVDGEPLLTMRDGCAGFFTAEDLASGRGVVQTELARRPQPGKRLAERLVPVGVESYDADQVEALRRGNLVSCFGPAFAELGPRNPLRLPGGRMRLVDRVPLLDPDGGRFGVGLIRAEADIDPDAWFLTCHFVDDQVMPGTLMYECCLHTLRIFLMRMGWIGAQDEAVWEPVPGVASGLKCRGQVTAATRTVTYEVTLKEIGYRPEPYAVADALLYADGKAIVEITNLSLQLSKKGTEVLLVEARERNKRVRVPFSRERILAFSIGKPSEAFGEPYRVFDEERIIARLPGPPYLFLDRITRIDAAPWQMVAGGAIEAEYDVPPDGWYFAADRQELMPFAVLLEIPLQACGWLAAYLGSALTSSSDLSFRNLGGRAELLEPVGRDAGTLTSRVKIARVASSAGMIIQGFEFAVHSQRGPVYCGETTFGFFSKTALAQQVGIREAMPYEPTVDEQARGQSFLLPREAPFPDDRWRMIDRVELLVPDGGPHGLGLIQGETAVDSSAWFFKAHFYQDPVWPGSLGLESLLQMLRAFAVERWPDARAFQAMSGSAHTWLYRGQVIPTNRGVQVQAVITGRDDARRWLTADGYLSVDGRVIYRMEGFTLEVIH